MSPQDDSTGMGQVGGGVGEVATEAASGGEGCREMDECGGIEDFLDMGRGSGMQKC